MRLIDYGLRTLAGAALAALPLLLAAPALAQPAGLGAISTAGAAVALPAAAPAEALKLDDTPDADGGGPPVPDRKVHGMVSVGVGTGGYREGAAVLTGPLGDTGSLTIAVDDVQFQGQQARRRAQPAPVQPPAQ